MYLVMPRKEAGDKILERIDRGSDLKNRPIQHRKAHEEVERAYWTWSEYNEELLRQLFTSPKIAEEYSLSIGIAIGGYQSLDQEINELHDSIDGKIRRLQSISARLELIPVSPGVGQSQSASRSATIANNKVFVVHGHNEAVRESVARFVDKLELKPIILHEQPSQGRTIMEKLEHHGDVAFAVVLLTPDDVGGTSSQELKARARQNVVFGAGLLCWPVGSRSGLCIAPRRTRASIRLHGRHLHSIRWRRWLAPTSR